MGPGLGGGEASGTARSPTQHVNSGHILSTGPVLGGGEASGTARSPRDTDEWNTWEDIDTASKEWDTWEVAGQTATPDLKDPRAGDHPSSVLSDDKSESGPLQMDDDGNRRCRLRRPLRSCPEAFTACGQELEESAAAGKGKGKRKRNKGKSDVRAGRGLGKPRDPVRPEDIRELRVAADGVFATSPDDTKYITRSGS